MPIEKLCINCGKEYQVYPSKAKSKYCSSKCSIEHQRGENAYTWCGGKTLNKDYGKEWQRENRNKGAFTHYSPEEEDVIRQLHSLGVELDKIAETTGRTKKGIKGKCFLMNLKYERRSVKNNSKHYKGGFREDLGHYVRSGWEANVARYLKWLINKGELKGYEYEPDTFEFHGIKRGNRSYTPDFKVYLNDGKIEYWEVKGYMDKDSRVKLNRMANYYPGTKLVLIDKDQYREIGKWSGLIEYWE